MKNKKTFLILILAFVLLMGGAFLLYDQLGSQTDRPQLSTQDTAPPQSSTDATSGEEIGQVAPGFTVYDQNNAPVSLSDFLGKPVVLNFWSSRCGPCQKEMPDFQNIYEQLGEEVHFLMVNMTDGYWDTVDSASGFIQNSGYTFPVFYDTAGSAAAAYGINSLPTTLFFDSDGNFVAYAVGAINEGTLLQGIEMIYPGLGSQS